MKLILSPIEQLVAKADPDRWAAALFAPPHERHALAALYAFAHEVGRIREVVSDPVLGAIRRQWWREAISEIYENAKVRQHETVLALAETVRLYQVEREFFDAYIDARELDFEQVPFATWADLLAYLDQTAGLSTVAASRVAKGSALSEGEREAASLAGRMWGLSGLMRSLPFWSQRRQTWFPEDLISEYEIEIEGLYAGKVTKQLHSLLGYCARQVRSAARSGSLRGSIEPSLYPALGYSSLALVYALRASNLADPFRERAQIAPIEKKVRLFLSAVTGKL